MPLDNSQRPFAPAPPQEGLGSYSTQGKRRWIEPVTSPGRYHTRRLVLAIVLIAVFLAAPHIQVSGHPLLHFDLAQRLFHILGVTFHPTDNRILVAFGLLVVLTLFTVTALFGRLWCGYFCPQPVFLEFIFRPIEALLEGPPEDRRRAHEAPRLPALPRKLLKWTIYVVLSSVIAHTLIAIFTGWSAIAGLMQDGPAAHAPLFVFTWIITGFLFVDFASFRENVCTMMCPYGRLQTALYDRDTRIVGYDSARGEPRGRPKNGPAGDCIDCRRCVGTCPTGIDIRRGLQMECIGCAECVDACDAIMKKIKRPPGLIRYTSLEVLEGGKTSLLRRRVVVYGVLWTAAFCTLAWLLTHRAVAETDILRAAHEPYRELPSGEVANQLRFRFMNRMDQDQDFEVTLLAPSEGKLIVSQVPFTVAPQHVEALNVAVILPSTAFSNGRTDARFRVTGNVGYQEEKSILLLGPYQ